MHDDSERDDRKADKHSLSDKPPPNVEFTSTKGELKQLKSVTKYLRLHLVFM